MQRTDLKIFKSERMTQQADAGGQRTGIEVENGQLNEVFGNISDIDHAQSAVDIVKVYPAVATNNTELLQDGHILINEPPLDPLVDVMIIESAAINDGSERADIVEAIESGITAGLLLRSGLTGMLAGQNTINRLDLASNSIGTEEKSVNLSVGQIICISVEYTGSESTTWPRKQHFAKVVSGGTADNVTFEPAIPFATPNRDIAINGQSRCTLLRAVNIGTGVICHGVTALTQNASSTTLNVGKTAGQLYPRITTIVNRLQNRPLLDEANITRKQLTVDADGLSYQFNTEDVATWATIEVLYVSAGISRTDATRSYNGSSISVLLNAMPDPGTKVSVKYTSTQRFAQYDSTSGALPAGWSLVLNFDLAGTMLYTNGTRYSFQFDPNNPTVLRVTRTGSVFDYQQAAIIDTSGNVTYYNGFSAIEYTGIIENNAAAVEQVYSASFTVPYREVVNSSLYISVEASAGGLVTASADNNGNITGTNVTGSIENGFVSLTFTVPVKASTLSYNIDEVSVLVPPTALYGINSLRIPNDGAVPLFRPFGVICIAHNQFTQYPSLTAAQAISRRPNSFIDIVDAEGASLWHPLQQHYEYDKDTGEVTIVDVTGFTAPFELIDTLSELALVTNVEPNQLKIAAPLVGSYPAGSIVSSVCQLGDMQALVGNLFDQEIWNGIFIDSIQGNPATASYNGVDHPIEVVNQSAINERWAIQFLGSSTAFRCVGEKVGQVGTGDIMNDFAPINPNTGQPYFVIRSTGWGGGWQSGNVLRFNTASASPPTVLLRSVSAGHSAIDQDSIRLHFRGNAQ
ncbi:hypothetical protein [Rheinheimera aquimaris]|uniref:hypothetical protein n=1 Tax=Rheinheimera aquimaris TaxID=412437 RepID=UPI003A9877D4